ncbi:MAG: hypothetical protein FWD90_03565 [Defluviitaleaceae bacterium]|nr:hypothetical protein [Defluviitaleaceae bacterium]
MSNAKNIFDEVNNFMNYDYYFDDCINKFKHYIKHIKGVSAVSITRHSPSFFTTLKEWQGLIVVQKTGQGFNIIITLFENGDRLIKLGVLNHELGHGFMHFDMLLNNASMQALQEKEATAFAELILKKFLHGINNTAGNEAANAECSIDNDRIKEILQIINPPRIND